MREGTELDSTGVRWRVCDLVAKPRAPVGRRTHEGMQSRFDLPMGNVPGQGGAWAGGWRRNGQKAGGVNQGDLSAQEPNGWSPGRHPSTTATERAGVRAPRVCAAQHTDSPAPCMLDFWLLAFSNQPSPHRDGRDWGLPVLALGVSTHAQSL